MSQLALFSALALVAMFGTASPAVAQTTETGTIEILVADQAGLPIPGVAARAVAGAGVRP